MSIRFTGDADQDLAAVGLRAAKAIVLSLPLLSDSVRSFVSGVGPRSLWTLALVLGAWSHQNQSIRLKALLGEIPTLPAYLSKSTPFVAFGRALQSADDADGLRRAASAFVDAVSSINTTLLRMLLNTPVWQKLEKQLAHHQVPPEIAELFLNVKRDETPRSRVRDFDRPLFRTSKA